MNSAVGPTIFQQNAQNFHPNASQTHTRYNLLKSCSLPKSHISLVKHY